jgi:phage anti-repressor protein
MKPEFTLELAQQLHDSNRIIDFDWAWQVLGYSTKGNAKRMLIGYFEQNFDYFVQLPEESPESLPYELFISSDKNSKTGRPTEKIYLTVECFKEMGMLSKSEEGRQIRKYFLECEAIAKQSVKVIPQLQQQIQQLQQSFELMQSQVQNLLPPSSDFIPPGWDTEVWASLPPQDKRHFRYLYRRRGFRAGSESEVKALPTGDRSLERAEIEHLINDVPEEELQLIETAKRLSLRRFWAVGGEL